MVASEIIFLFQDENNYFFDIKKEHAYCEEITLLKKKTVQNKIYLKSQNPDNKVIYLRGSFQASSPCIIIWIY